MSVFTMADLHLSISCPEKSMDIFGARWAGSLEKIRDRWQAVVGPSDSVIIPGDISWALSLNDAIADLAFIDALPGRKYVGRGNHDYWWSSLTKMSSTAAASGITTISFLQNNAYRVEDLIVCGSRGWFSDEKMITGVYEKADYQKVMDREAIRLRMSLDQGKRLYEEQGGKLLVFLHFPPVWNGIVSREIVDVLHEYGVTECYFGHIHGQYQFPGVFRFEDITMRLVAADFLDFYPIPVS